MKRLTRGRLAVALVAGWIALGATPAKAEIGLNVDLQFASTYAFRGWNLFQEDDQMDQHFLFGPSVTWSVFDTGLAVGWWGAFQLNGANRSANIDGGVGAEQDLYVTYALALPYDLSLSASVFAYLYPFAEEASAGVAFPAYLEPGVGLTWDGPVSVSFKTSYFAGLQEELAPTSWYLYLSLGASKTFSLHEKLGLSVGLAGGFKLFKDTSLEDNVWDVAATVALPIQVTDFLYVKPSFNAGWTDIEAKGFGDEIMVWGNVNVGADF